MLSKYSIRIHAMLVLVALAACSGTKVQPSAAPTQVTGDQAVISEKATLQLLNDFSTWRCETMVQTVNALRHLGKEKSLKLLADYLAPRPVGVTLDQRLTVTLVGRLLFVAPPEGWGVFEFGTDPDPVMDVARKDYPLFPVVMSKGIPILVIERLGFTGGPGDQAEETLRRARDLQIIASDLPTTGFERAAQDVIQQESFKRLYPDPSIREKLAKIITERAGK